MYAAVRVWLEILRSNAVRLECVYVVEQAMKKESSLRLTWRLDNAGYRIENRVGVAGTFLSDLSRPRGETFIVPASGRLKVLVIERGDERGRFVSLDLVNMRHTPQAALDFANDWGLLTADREAEVSSFYNAGTKLWSQWLAHHLRHRRLVMPSRHLPKIGQGLAADASCVNRIPDDLEGYCWHEMMEIIDLMKACDYCGNLYIPRPRAGKCRFCADSCRQKFHDNGKERPAGPTGVRIAGTPKGLVAKS